MRNEPPLNDPQLIWQNQKTEQIQMSLTELKHNAEKHRTRAMGIAIMNDVTFLGLMIYLGFLFVNTPRTTARIGIPLLIAGGLYVTYRQHTRLWPEPRVPNASPGSGIEAYRRALTKSYDDSRNVWRMLLPLLPGLVISASPGTAGLIRQVTAHPALLINTAPFCALLAIWLVFMFPVRRRRLLRIRHEIENLDGLMDQTRTGSAG